MLNMKIYVNFTIIRFHFTFYLFSIMDWFAIKFISNFELDFFPGLFVLFSILSSLPSRFIEIFLFTIYAIDKNKNINV